MEYLPFVNDFFHNDLGFFAFHENFSSNLDKSNCKFEHVPVPGERFRISVTADLTKIVFIFVIVRSLGSCFKLV